MNIRALIPDSGYRSPWLSYGMLYFLSVCMLLFEFRYCFYGVFAADSMSYEQAAELLTNGRIDNARTPIYPLLIALGKAIGGPVFRGTVLVIIQSAIFLVSVGVFRRIALHVLKSARGCFWATAFYAIWPAYSGIAMFVMTESLAMSFAIFMAWSLLRKLPERPGVREALESGIWLFLLIFLRPHMMCLIPVYSIFWIAVAVKFRRNALRQVLTVGLMLTICGVALMAYKSEMKRVYGIDSVSVISNANKYYLVRTSGLLRPEMCESPRMRAHIDSMWQKDPYETGDLDWEDYRCIRDSIPPCEIQEALNRAVSSNPLGLASGIATQLKFASNYNVFYYPWMTHMWEMYDYFPVPMWVYMVFMCGAFVWMIVRRKGLALWTLWLVSASISGSAVVGAMWEWNRLFSPGMPEAIILVAAAFMGAYRVWLRSKDSR